VVFAAIAVSGHLPFLFQHLITALPEDLTDRSMPMIGILDAINIPCYEEIAHRINWLAYHNFE
jgi:hypothetical protein